MTSLKFRILIVDDEALARDRIRALLEHRNDVELIGECASGYEAVEAIQRLNPDLVYLDVQMPELDGFEVLARLGTASLPTVIFVTAFDTYALKAFEVHALDYLLKPFDRERFETSLERAILQTRNQRNNTLNQRFLALLDDIRSENRHLERFVIKTGGRIYFLKSDEIDWIEAAGNYVRLHSGSQSHLLRETMNGIEAQLDRSRFVRIHRSVIVNIECIKDLLPLFHGDYSVRLQDGTELTLSRTYRDRLQSILGRSL